MTRCILILGGEWDDLDLGDDEDDIDVDFDEIDPA